MIRLSLLVLAVVIGSSGCAAPSLIDQTVELRSRHLRVAVQNHSSRPIAISFDSNTLLVSRLIEPGHADTVVFDPEPARPFGGLLENKEAWALAWGKAVTDPAGNYIGMRTPIQIAVSREPLESTMAEIFVVIGEEDAGWRVGGP